MRAAPYGSWSSPISSELITKAGIRLGSVLLDGNDLYWAESRPLESGRSVIVCKPENGEIYDVTPPAFNVRTLAHEYGGGAFTVHKGTVYFCNYADQLIYKQERKSAPVALTSAANVRYADMVVDEKHNRLICVQEDHSEPGQEPISTISAVSLKDGSVDMLIAGNDFYATPRISPNGMFLSWMSWNHPNLPWDESFIWCANLGSDGYPSNMRLIAGGPGESVSQPRWSPSGELYYISDRSGWWKIYRHSDYEDETEMVPSARDLEFGLPQWVFGISTYAFESDDTIVCAYGHNAVWKLGRIDTRSALMETLDLPFTEFSYVQAKAGTAYCFAGSPTETSCIAEIDTDAKNWKILRKSGELTVDSHYISEPQPIEFSTAGGKTAYAFFYPPKNKDFEAPSGELPPLIVRSHGGPTSAAYATLNTGLQYWTSRGFAVVDVNYGGSTGFGRDYRSRLYNSWGIVDVEDCVNAAKYLVENGLVDGKRLIITGGSAGGYTTLCALSFHDLFKAGASHYGVSDLEALAKDTHKFESRYLDRLVGPYPVAKEIYEQRSPINFVDQLSCPVIFLQGLEDKVVPPNQSETMVNALKKKGIPVAYVTFEGEQHGFRKAENIRRAVEAELYFYSQIFGFDLPEKFEPLPIHNLDKAAVG